MVSPNTTIWAIPLAGLTTPSVPKATEINAGTNISAAVKTGYSIKFNDSDTDDSMTIVDEGGVVTPTLKNYECKFSLFKDEVGTGTQAAPVPATIFTTAAALFATAWVDFWIVTRHGRKNTVAAAATHIVSVFKIKNDHTRTIEEEGGKPILVEIEGLPQGEAYANVACQA